ncbi:Gfo/Idh/MocA family oxidoreductase [Oerskovia sp. M15]
MVLEQRVDTVVVTSPDRTHADVVARAVRAGADVVLEKPMTTTVEGCREILAAIEETGRDLVLTFNYRYSPRNTALKEVVASGEIGTVTAVHFEWVLDTVHGADYFRRWHRDKGSSGGLLVHKASHHFDLVNWWLDDSPSWSSRVAACASTGPTAQARPRRRTPRRVRAGGSAGPVRDGPRGRPAARRALRRGVGARRLPP